MITAFFMGWTDSITKKWFPISKLTWHSGKCYEVYLQGILDAVEVSPLKKYMLEFGVYRINEVEISDRLTRNFSKLIPPNRSSLNMRPSPNKLDLLTLPGDTNRLTPFEYAARDGSPKHNNHDIFPQVTPDECGIYNFYFGNMYVDGLKIDDYKKINNYIDRLNIGDLLSLINNSIYHNGYLLGEVPGYIADLYEHCPEAFKMTVAKINYTKFRFWNLICHVEIQGDKITPFSDRRYQPLIAISAEQLILT
jgi:hypothetical protein